MDETTKESPPDSGNISNEETLIKSEKMYQPSENKFKPSLESEKQAEKLLKGNEAENNTAETKTQKEKTLNEILPDDKQFEYGKDAEDKLLTKQQDASEKRTSESVPCCPKQPKARIIRNQSDIFSLKDISTTLQTSIFSINGSPSRKLFRKQEPEGHVFQRTGNPPSDKTASPRENRITRENYNDEKRPSSSYRNPLTGMGLSSNDEYKSKGNKRKDGNPLLGLGYDSEVTSASSQHRIPPGGYSHKLW